MSTDKQAYIVARPRISIADSFGRALPLKNPLLRSVFFMPFTSTASKLAFRTGHEKTLPLRERVFRGSETEN